MDKPVHANAPVDASMALMMASPNHKHDIFSLQHRSVDASHLEEHRLVHQAGAEPSKLSGLDMTRCCLTDNEDTRGRADSREVDTRLDKEDTRGRGDSREVDMRLEPKQLKLSIESLAPINDTRVLHALQMHVCMHACMYVCMYLCVTGSRTMKEL